MSHSPTLESSRQNKVQSENSKKIVGGFFYFLLIHVLNEKVFWNFRSANFVLFYTTLETTLVPEKFQKHGERHIRIEPTTIRISGILSSYYSTGDKSQRTPSSDNNG